MTAKRAFSTPRLRAALAEKAKAPTPAQAVPVYTLGLSDLAAEKDVSAAVNTGWRYGVMRGEEIVAHGETVIDPAGKHHFAATSEGPLVEGTAKALDAAEAEDEIKNGEFEVRFLQVPALYVAALWLVNKRGGPDYAVPVAPAPPPLVPNKLVPFDNFLMILHEEARKHLAALRDDATSG
ncbi:MAG: hypothetical protein ACXV4B_00225 [Halobacteriota archaeon]